MDEVPNLLRKLSCEIFTGEFWGIHAGIESLEFHDVELVVPVGDYPVGATFSRADIDMEEHEMTFYQEDEVVAIFELKLELRVGKVKWI